MSKLQSIWAPMTVPRATATRTFQQELDRLAEQGFRLLPETFRIAIYHDSVFGAGIAQYEAQPLPPEEIREG